MALLVKGNAEVRVPDAEVATYIEKGYTLLDKNGRSVKVNLPRSYDELVSAFNAVSREATRAKARIKELENALDEARAMIEAEKKAKHEHNTSAEPPKTSQDAQTEESQATEQGEEKPRRRANKA